MKGLQIFNFLPLVVFFCSSVGIELEIKKRNDFFVEGFVMAKSKKHLCGKDLEEFVVNKICQAVGFNTTKSFMSREHSEKGACSWVLRNPKKCCQL